MVHCEFSLLLQIHHKVRMLMQCMKIPQSKIETTPNQKSIISDIVLLLDKSLQEFFVRGQVETQPDQEDAYAGIQKELQRQEQVNRSLIRRELEFKEYQKTIIDELSHEKKIIEGLQTELLKANEISLAKDFEILQLSKDKRITKQKKPREVMPVDIFINDKKMGNTFNFNVVKESTQTLHRRGRSDELYVRSTTTNTTKKKGNAIKK